MGTALAASINIAHLIRVLVRTVSEAGTIPVGAAPDLPEYYYRDNFVALCDSVIGVIDCRQS